MAVDHERRGPGHAGGRTRRLLGGHRRHLRAIGHAGVPGGSVKADLVGDGSQPFAREPALVLALLVPVQPLVVAPELPLASGAAGGDGRVGGLTAEEGEIVEGDPQPARLHEPADDLRFDGGRVGAAGRALEIFPFVQYHLRRKRAQRPAGARQGGRNLRDGSDQPERQGAGRPARRWLLQVERHDDTDREEDREPGEQHDRRSPGRGLATRGACPPPGIVRALCDAPIPPGGRRDRLLGGSASAGRVWSLRGHEATPRRAWAGGDEREVPLTGHAAVETRDGERSASCRRSRRADGRRNG